MLGSTEGCWHGSCAEQRGPLGPLSPSVVTGAVCPSHRAWPVSLGAHQAVAYPGPCVQASLATTTCRTRGPWCVEPMQGAGSSQNSHRKAGARGARAGQCVVFVLHPWMDSSSPGHACRGTCLSIQELINTHPTLLLGLSKSQCGVVLVGSCGAQELGQGGVGECRDVPGHCTDC